MSQEGLQFLCGVAVGLALVITITCAAVTAGIVHLVRIAEKWTKAYLND